MKTFFSSNLAKSLLIRPNFGKHLWPFDSPKSTYVLAVQESILKHLVALTNKADGLLSPRCIF